MRARHRAPSGCLVLVLLGLACSSSGPHGPPQPSPPPPTAEWRAPVDGNALYGLTWAGTQWAAVGSGGMVLTSPDGASWTNHPTPTRHALLGIAWSGTRFVAVGGDYLSGTGGTILVSTDGRDWTLQASVPSTLMSVVWSGSQFVAVGWNGTIVTSPDGLQWTARSSGTATFLLAVAWSGSRFVAVGWTILTSPDGVSWTEHRSGAPATFGLNSVVWTGTRFVAVGGFEGNGLVLTSPDGFAWTSQALGSFPPGAFNSVAWSGTRLVAVGGETYASPDGVAWTPTGNVLNLNAVAWSGTEFIGVGYNGTVAGSAGGGGWELRVAPPSNTLVGVAWSGTTFVAVGNWGTILTSNDGVSWTSRPIGTRHWLSAVIWTGTEFLALGAGWDGMNQTTPLVLASPDGVAWTPLDARPAAYSFTAVTKVAALSGLVAVGGYGAVLTSADGRSWTMYTPASCGLTGVAALGSRVVSVGWCQTVVRSENGVDWMGGQVGEMGDAFFGIAASPNGFVAVGWGTGIFVVTLTSADGVQWTRRTPPLFETLNAIAWIGGQFVAVGDSGSIVTSLDGVSWTPRTGESRGELRAVAGDATRLVAVGSSIGSAGTIETHP